MNEIEKDFRIYSYFHCRFQRTNSEDMWSKIAPQISAILSSNRISLPEEEHPMPFDAAIETPIEEQK